MATVDASISEAASASDESATLHALAPIADVSVGGSWTNPAGGSLYPAIDESVASGSDFVRSGDDPQSDPVEFQHAVASSTSAPRVIAYEAKATGGGQVNVTVELWCASTLIATFTDNNVGSVGKYFHQLTAAQRAAITDKSLLYTKVITTRVGNTVNASITEAANAIDAASAGSDELTSDFASRRSGSGVVNSWGFDSSDEIPDRDGATDGGNFGTVAGTSPPYARPVLDSTIKCGSGSSLRFDIPTLTGSDPCGGWFANFTTDLSVLFGAGSEFFMQWRQRFNQAFVDTYFLDIGGGQGAGIKQIIVGTGNAAGLDVHDATSCSDIDVVAQTYYQHRFPRLYNACYYYDGLDETIPSDLNFQNQLASPYCLYSANQDSSTTANGACFGWVADEWLTFKLWIKLGARNDSTWRWDDSEVKLWGGREGQSTQLLHWWRPGIGGYFGLRTGDPNKNQRFGKVWLTPYMTDNDDTVSHATCTTWYDELIISTQDIADPLIPPTWLADIPLDDGFHAIANTSMSGAGVSTHAAFWAWAGFAWDEQGGSAFMSCQGGHGDSGDNSTNKIDLTEDVPAWTCIQAASATIPSQSDADSINVPASSTTGMYYYSDGRPCSRHVYWGAFFIGQRGVIYLPFTSARWGQSGGSDVFGDGFHLDSLEWDAAGDWPDGMAAGPGGTVAKDVSTGNLYCVSSGGTVSKWTQATSPRGAWGGISPSSGGGANFPNHATLIDKTNGRNRWICAPGDGYLYCIDLTSLTTTTITLSGVTINNTPNAANSAYYAGLVHDEDADRYIMVCGDGSVVSIHPTSGVVTSLTGTTWSEAGQNVGMPHGTDYGVFSRVAYLPRLGVIAHYPLYSDNMYVMRTR